MVEAPQDVKKILYITMSNLGDVLMALPAFDFLRRTFRNARITVVAGTRTKVLFETHPDVDRLIVYDKQSSLGEKKALFRELQAEGFDVVIDLKNSFYRWGLRARFKNPAWVRMPSWIEHSRHEHLYKTVLAVGGRNISKEEFLALDARRNPSFIRAADHGYVDDLLAERGIAKTDTFVLVAPGARSDLKKWHISGYAQVIRELPAVVKLPVVVIGDRGDRAVIERVVREAGVGVVALIDQTDFSQLAALVQRARFIICNDSGVLHLGSYLGVPVIGIYGPSNERRYGPWSAESLVVRKHVACAPCEKAHCARGRVCIEMIRPYDVLLAVQAMMGGPAERVRWTRPKRILVARTDRIGDVLLSTPAIKALRTHYPTSYIAMMVSPYTRQIVEGNPYLDEVIVVDKRGRHRGLLATWRLARALRQKDFDVAVVLHPTVRVHLLCFLAGIRERIGYDRKAPYFLTRTIPHKKQEGRKHELEYNFDLLEPLGITTVEREIYMPIRADAERDVEGRLRKADLDAQALLVAISPAASDLSRRWPCEKFAALIDHLGQLPGVRIVVVAEAAHRAVTQDLLSMIHVRVVDFTGAFDLSQLASLFRRCRLVVSNDSGPVHLAVAVHTPVIAIFGRNQAGLSPERWRPLGPRDIVVHKKMACAPCLAHACTRGFQCLEAISVDELFRHAQGILKSSEP